MEATPTPGKIKPCEEDLDLLMIFLKLYYRHIECITIDLILPTP